MEKMGLVEQEKCSVAHELQDIMRERLILFKLTHVGRRNPDIYC